MDPDDTLNGSMPRDPRFSLDNNLLIFTLQGYEWTYGDILYNSENQMLTKLPNTIIMIPVSNG